MRVTIVLAAVGLVLLAAAVSTAEPSFPGHNGHIAFVTAPDGDADIYTISPQGCDLFRVTTASGRDIYPSWSPDGTKMTYQRDFSAGVVTGTENWVIGADGTGAIKLTPPNEGGDGRAEWSPDGSRLAFRHETDPHRRPTFRSWEIFTIAPDGTGLLRLTTNEVSDDSPTYSPDGTKIAFTRRAATTDEFNPAPEEIWVMDSDGTDQVQLTNNQFRDFEPQWSPNGDQILFTSLRTGSQTDLYLVDVLTGAETELATLPLPERAAWSPDGSRIVYSEANDIYEVTSDQSVHRRLAAGVGKFPSYSPDGTMILFSGADEFTVRTMNSDGQQRRRVFGDRDRFVSGGPFLDWQPTGPPPPVTDTDPPNITAVRDFPDPFSPNGGLTFIRFETSEHASITISLHRNGNRVARPLNNRFRCAGFIEIPWRGRSGGRAVPDGTYTYRIEAEDAAGNVGRASGKVTVRR